MPLVAPALPAVPVEALHGQPRGHEQPVLLQPGAERQEQNVVKLEPEKMVVASRAEAWHLQVVCQSRVAALLEPQDCRIQHAALAVAQEYQVIVAPPCHQPSRHWYGTSALGLPQVVVGTQ